MILGRDQILASKDLRRELVPTPEWAPSGEVWVRAMTAKERGEIEKDMGIADGRRETTGLREKVCARCVVDAEGDQIFTDADMVALGGKAASAMDRCFSAAMRLSRLKPEDFEAAVEDLPEGQSEGSPTS